MTTQELRAALKLLPELKKELRRKKDQGQGYVIILEFKTVETIIAALEAQPVEGWKDGATPSPCNESLEQWIDRSFSYHAAAIRREDEPAIPGEPFMSMATAMDLVRKAVKDFSASPVAKAD